MRLASRDYESRLIGGLVWAGIVLLSVGGLMCITLPPSGILPFTKDNSLITNTLENIGYGLLGGGLTTLVFRLTTGLGETLQQERMKQSLGALQQNIDRVPQIISKATAEQQQAIAAQQERILELSNLLATASSLGIVAMAGDRDSAALSDMTWAQRWKYLLEHAHELDLLCWEDRRIFAFDMWLSPGTSEAIIGRLRSGDLKLRILLSTLDNPALDLVNKWIGIERFMQQNVQYAEDLLQKAAISTQFPILRRHRELLAFTLLRADSELYIMYFFPKHGAGPIFRFAPPEVLEAVAHGRGHKASLYTSYKTYFDDLWDECDPAKQQSKG